MTSAGERSGPERFGVFGRRREEITAELLRGRRIARTRKTAFNCHLDIIATITLTCIIVSVIQ
ncbi:hypothetical protein V8F06_005007 [Rhypophila decipiens]